MKRATLAIICLFWASSATAQNNISGNPITFTLVAPTTGVAGSCSTSQAWLWVPTSTGALYQCVGTNPTASWQLSAGGGGGVSSVIISGTTNQITATGTCTITTSGTCTLGISSSFTLPISTGITGLGTGVASALATAVSGSGAICLASGSLCGGGSSLPTISCVDAAGSGSAYTCPSSTPSLAAYVVDQLIAFTPGTINSVNNPTLAVSGLAALNLVGTGGSVIYVGSLQVGQTYILYYNGSNLVVTNISQNTYNALNAAPQGGFLVQNTTAATVSQQQVSPYLSGGCGTGWATTGSTSRNACWYSWVGPASGSAPTATLLFGYSVGAGVALGVGTPANAVTFNSGNSITSPTIGLNGSGVTGIWGGGTHGIVVDSNGAAVELVHDSYGIVTSSTLGIGFAASTISSVSSNQDTAITRYKLGWIGANTGSFSSSAPCSNTAAACGFFAAAGYMDVGTTFTATGCGTPTSLTGGSTAGSFLAGTLTVGCTVTITMGNTATAPTGWSCSGSDQTSTLAMVEQSSTTTQAVLAASSAITGDKITFSCTGY